MNQVDKSVYGNNLIGRDKEMRLFSAIKESVSISAIPACGRLA